MLPGRQSSWVKAMRSWETASEEVAFDDGALAMDRRRVRCTRQTLSSGFVSGTPINLAGSYLEYSSDPARRSAFVRFLCAGCEVVGEVAVASATARRVTKDAVGEVFGSNTRARGWPLTTPPIAYFFHTVAILGRADTSVPSASASESDSVL